MKKRKNYEISVIDKTYSKIISDETKFYTSDTALELGFELKETEYTFESAEIVLLNIDDRSLVTRPVAKNLDGFTYELEDDVIAHYGEWHGQLRFEQAEEIYVSSPVKFRIDNDLSNERPPQLSDVQSWVSLKRYADSLVDELKQAVLSIEGIEDTFNENELERQTTFETAERSRQTTFETNESERDRTFESNETTRQAQELEREGAETARQQAETQRASAESSRVSSEAQRKIDHANRSAELAGKADKVVIENLVVNGNFSNGTLGWVGNTATIREVINGEVFAEMTNISTNSATIGKSDSIKFKKGHKYFVHIKHRQENPFSENRFRVRFFGGSYVGGRDYYLHNTNTFIIEPTSDGTSESQYFTYLFNTSGNYVGHKMYLSDYMIIDLTETFGAGSEPTKKEMDELIKVTGYIDGEYALNSEELLMWTISLVRSNRNAIIALGGTI